MPLVRVSPDDLGQVGAVVGILEAARLVDDPAAHPTIAAELASEMRYGWDLQPDEHFLYLPDGAGAPVATLAVDLPKRDNLQLLWLRLVVHPEHRRQGHGSAVMAEVLRMAERAGRSILWVEAVEEDAGARKFCERFGFGYASHDARRRQTLAEVDQDAVRRLEEEAQVAAADYRLERLLSPVPEETLQEMIEVTAAINDAPMGELTFEDEVFDLQRMRDVEARDLMAFLGSLPQLRAIAFNGGTAARLGRASLGASFLPLVDLPSSSPAYTLPFADKAKRWNVLRPLLVD
jgi:GNAT superfamily N-acetyltransferase